MGATQTSQATSGPNGSVKNTALELWARLYLHQSIRLRSFGGPRLVVSDNFKPCHSLERAMSKLVDAKIHFLGTVRMRNLAVEDSSVAKSIVLSFKAVLRGW